MIRNYTRVWPSIWRSVNRQRIIIYQNCVSKFRNYRTLCHSTYINKLNVNLYIGLKLIIFVLSSRIHSGTTSRRKKRLLQVTKQFWKRSKIQTSETITLWTSIHKPGGIMMLSSSNVLWWVILSGEDEESYGRWSYTIYGGKEKLDWP